MSKISIYCDRSFIVYNRYHLSEPYNKVKFPTKVALHYPLCYSWVGRETGYLDYA